MTDLSKVLFMSTLSGLGNYGSNSVTGSVPAQSLGAFASADVTFTLNITSGAISLVQTNYSLETIRRTLSGRHIIYKPDFASAQYTIQSIASFTSSVLTITVRISNATAGSISTPAFTFSAKVFQYKAPFVD